MKQQELYTHTRNYGCRYKLYTQNGVEMLSLENAKIKVVFALVLEHLHSHRALHNMIVCLKNNGHSADADHLIDPVSVVEDLTNIILKHRLHLPALS